MAVVEQEVTEKYALYNGDSCQVLPQLPDESVDLSIYSPPFAELYNYSSSDEDLSNCRNYDEFLLHYEFIVKEMARLTKPGRINVVHCMDLMKPGGNGYRDFPGDILRLHEKHGFLYHGKVHVWKEPLMVKNKTMLKSLRHVQIVDDATVCAPANPDTVLILRKKGKNKVPVEHKQEDGHLQDYFGVWDQDERKELGLAPIPHENLKNKGRTDLHHLKSTWSHWVWRQYASSVWMDIKQNRLMPYDDAKENPEEKHICPLQLDVISRFILLYSNKGETVLSPFAGVGSEPVTAVKMDRRGIGIELKPSYYRQAVANMKAMLEEKKTEELDLLSGIDL